MANIKIDDLVAYTDPVSTDVLAIVDVGNDLTKKVSIADLVENAGTGSAAAPSFSFDGDNNTGIYRPAADQVALTAGGTQALLAESTGITIPGNLTVSGTTTTIDTTTLVVEDKNIEIGKVSTPSDTTADGGGITLKGATDKTINWVNSTDAWTFSEHINIANAKEYRINGTKVLDATSLGSAVVGSSLTSVGTIATGVWNGTAIAGTKISPDFGSQAVTTTGLISADGKVSFPLGTAALPSLYPGSDTNTGIYSPGADQVAVATNGTGRLFITSDGKINIGSVARIENTGEVKAANGTESEPSFSFLSDPDNGMWRPTTNTLGFSTAGSEALRITSAGLVGIGTASPSSKLQVTANAGNSNNVEIRLQPTNSTGGVNPDAIITAEADGTYGAHLFFTTRATSSTRSERLRITSDGNVGIGTSSPGAPLGLNYSSSSTYSATTDAASAATFFNTNSAVNTYAALKLSTYGSGSGSSMGTVNLCALASSTSYGAEFAIQQRTTTGAFRENLRITHDGKVGIGTTTPSSNGLVTIYEGSGAKLYLSDGVLGLNYGARLTGGGIGGQGGYAELGVVDNNVYNKAITVTAQANNIIFGKGATEKARIDTSGRLLVGTSSSFTLNRAATLQVAGGTGSSSPGAFIAATRFGTVSGGGELILGASYGSNGSHGLVPNDFGVGQIRFTGSDGANGHDIASVRAFVDGTPGANDMPGRLTFSTTADGASSPTERMRITSTGYMLIGNISSLPSASVFGLGLLRDGTGGAIYSSRNNTSSTDHIEFFNPNGKVGSISTNASATAYNTSSDYRLKENVAPVTDGITRLQQLKPSRFNFIADPDTVVDGFIAHEVQTIVPEAITGEKDAVDDEGNPEYQGIDQSKLVPLLTAALQEAVAKIESLEARLTAAGI